MTLPRHAELWLPGYLRSRLRNWASAGPSRVWVAIADHWEPLGGHASEETAAERVALWVKHWPEIARRHADSTGQAAPQYTFYYPQEEYRPSFLDALAEMKRAGMADVDVHIHHDGEGQQNFVDRMSGFIETLVTRHGLLRLSHGRPVFGFIHGNWALDNSRPDGRWCGLNNEITLLRELGCYADFTMPVWKLAHSVAYRQHHLLGVRRSLEAAILRPRSGGETGRAGFGRPAHDPRPLRPPMGGTPHATLENGEIAYYDLPTPYRVKRWLDLAPRIGRDIFIKLYTHGAQEPNPRPCFQGGLDRLFHLLVEACGRRGHQLRYVSTWEMRQAVDAAAGVASAGAAARLTH